MNKLFTLIATAALVAGSFTANAQWVDVSSVSFTGTATQVISNNGNLFTGVGTHLYRSTDMGATWTLLSVYNGYDFAIIHTGTALIAGGGSNNGNDTTVYVSLDNGGTWAKNNTVTGTGAFTINVFAKLGSEVIAGLGGSMNSDAYRSSNDGTLFTSCGPSAVHEVRSITADGVHIYAGTQYNGVYQYTNVAGSAVWVHLDTAGLPSSGSLINNINAVCVVNGKVWAASGSGVYELDTVAHHWSAVVIGANSTTCFCVAGSTIVRGTYGGGIYYSTNNGTTWTQDNTGMSDLQISSLAYSGDTLFTGTRAAKVYRRTISSFGTPAGVAATKMGTTSCTVFPNPASTMLRINATGKITADIYSATGMLMQHETNNSDINISALAAGVYIVRITDENGGVEVQRFTKL